VEHSVGVGTIENGIAIAATYGVADVVGTAARGVDIRNVI
jgi:hypothetical protein